MIAKFRIGKVVLALAAALALPHDVCASDATDARIKDLRALIKTAKYADAEAGLRSLLAELQSTSGTDSLDVAHVLEALVSALWRGGKARAPETASAAERALTLKEGALGPNDPDVAMSVQQVALVHSIKGEFDAARPLYERALAIREKALGPVHPDVAESLNGLASLFWATGDYASARPLYERSLAIQEKTLGPDDPGVASALLNLASLLRDTGEYAEARPMFERAIAIREAKLGPDHPDLGAALNGLAVLFRVTGDYAAARPLYERASEIQKRGVGPDHPNVAVAANNLANLLNDQGDYAAARPLYERATKIWENALGPDHSKVADGLHGLAMVSRATGDYAAARSYYERALAIREKTLGPEHPDVGASLDGLANVARSMGDYEAARDLYDRALAVFVKALGGEHVRVANTYSNLGNLLEATGDHDGARASYERAVAIHEKTLGPDNPDLAGDLAGLAEVLLASGHDAEARPLLERALAIQNKTLGPDHPHVATSLVALARASLSQGDAVAALTQSLDAERISRDHLRLTCRSLSERQALALAATRTSGLDLAETVAARGVGIDSRRRAFDAVIRSRAVVLDEMAARHRAGRSADPEVAQLGADLSAARARLANLFVRGPEQGKPERYRALLDGAREDQEKAERALAEASKDFAIEATRGRLGLDDVAASLPVGGALVAFTEYGQLDAASSAAGEQVASVPNPPSLRSYLAFVLCAGEVEPSLVPLGSAEAIDALVARWKQEASAGAWKGHRSAARSEDAYRAAGAALREKVWDPVVSALHGAGRVFVVPDGSLNLVSFAALPAETGGYLIETGPLVHYLSAERDMVRSGDDRRGEGLLAVGAPSFDAGSLFASLAKGGTAAEHRAPGAGEAPMLLASSDTYRGHTSDCGEFAASTFRPLPATAEEIHSIVRLWREYQASEPSAPIELRQVEANETALKRLASGRRVLHLATHGFFLGGCGGSAPASSRGIGALIESPNGVGDTPPPVIGENPLLLSGLVLAGANHRAAAAADEDDGILTAEEIASLDLSGVSWAVLSACETGVGDIHAGEGVFGLRRAFQVAGAGTLIMSLWSVDDEATRSWMQALYESSLRDHRDTAEAVRGASLEVLRDRRARRQSTHPFFWAAFVAAGDWR